MKIAIVNQPHDKVLPPNQGSVGLCTYGTAKSLSKWSEVLVYGLKDRNRQAHGCLENVSFFFLPSTATDRLTYKLRCHSTNLIDPRSPASTSSWLFQGYGRQVAVELQKQQCDVIHIQQCSQYAGVIRELNPDSKIVLHLHAPWFSQSNFKMLAARLRAVDLVTTVSDFVTSKLRQDFPMIADRCETAYNGIDPDQFPDEKDYHKAASRKEKRILFVGALAPHSGVHILLDAFRIVAHEFPDVHLDLIGGRGGYPIEEVFDLKDWLSIQSVARFYRRDYSTRLKAKLSLLPPDAGTYIASLKAQLQPALAGKVTFVGSIGSRSELISRYYDADIFVFPPVCNHGFGLPPLEAMAAGTAVVATRSGGIGETVRDRETGLLVAKNDAHGLAEAMLALLKNDTVREDMGRAGRKLALNSFTWDIAAAKLYDRYRTLCHLKRPESPESMDTGAAESTKPSAAAAASVWTFSERE